MLSELNSTNIIYNEITNDYLKYLRPPYNNYNNDVLNEGYEIVTWNIDTNDWLNRNTDEIYNNVIENACDGCIVLMHDIYEESIIHFICCHSHFIFMPYNVIRYV